MPTESNSYAALTALFSSATYRDLATELPSFAIGRIAAAISGGHIAELSTLKNFLDTGYAVLSKHYRNEYVFKNTIVSKLIFGRHKPTTASAFLEFPAGDSFADVLVLNGSSTAYEIKTDLDSFSRLSTQVRDYQTRFEFVNLVVSVRRAPSALRRLPKGVGLIAVHNNGRMQALVKATSNQHMLSAEHIFRSLRQREVQTILARLDKLPNSADPVEQWHAQKRAFISLNPTEAHASMVPVLRRRGQKTGEIASRDEFPPSALALAYGTRLTGKGQARILHRLALPLPLVLGP